jgi:hypothetical protein
LFLILGFLPLVLSAAVLACRLQFFAVLASVLPLFASVLLLQFCSLAVGVLLFLFSLPFPCLVVCWGLCLFVVGWSVL